MADWQGGGLRISPYMQPAMRMAMPNAWAIRNTAATDPVVVLMSAAAREVHVYTRVAAASAPVARVPVRGARVVDAAFTQQARWSGSGGSGAGRLPRIITPHG